MALKTIVSIVTLSVMLQFAVCKPVNKRGPPSPDPVEAGSPAEAEAATGLEYDRYLRQVVEVLESDNEFRKKLETANISDIKSGAIAMHLELVNNTIRTKLDEIKRMEIQRLQELARIKMKSMSGVNRMDIPTHLDLRNPHSFEMKDLESLIKKTTNDLEELDKQRREDFKTYEMEKEFEYQEKLKNLPEEEKKQMEQQHEELKKKHQQHEKINHPGSKDQFEEVWEKDDKLEDQDFDPKTFFLKHDLNGDRMWDIQEVEAVLQRELDKVYDARNSPEEDDPMERFEEMNRMREHVFTEIDKNKDLMITMEEFIAYTGAHGENDKFKEDEGWETIDEKPAFTEEELQEYMRQHHAQPGVIQAPVDNSLHFSPEQQQMLHQQQNMGQQGMPQHGMPPQGMPQQGMPQQGMPPQGMPPQGMAPVGGIPPNPPVQQQQFNQQQQLNQQQQQFQQQQFQQQQFQQQQLNQQQLNHQQLNQQQLNQQAAQQQVNENSAQANEQQQLQQPQGVEQRHQDGDQQQLNRQEQEEIGQQEQQQEQEIQQEEQNQQPQGQEIIPQEEQQNAQNPAEQQQHQAGMAVAGEVKEEEQDVELPERRDEEQQLNQVNQGQPVQAQPVQGQGQPVQGQGQPVQGQGQPVQGQPPVV